MASAPLPSPAAPDTRERILDAAEALFAEHGFAGTAVRDIARRVGLTPASLYNHFRGKQELYESVLERGVRPLLERMQILSGADAGRDPGSVSELIDGVMEHLASRPHLPRLIQFEAVTGGAHLARLARGWIRPLIEQGAETVRRTPESDWSEEEAPLLIFAWMHLVFGHFAVAPLLGEIIGRDPLSPAMLERQTRLLKKLAGRMSQRPSTRGD